MPHTNKGALAMRFQSSETRALPTTEIREMVPYRVQSKMMIPKKKLCKLFYIRILYRLSIHCNFKLYNLPIETLYN